MQETYRYQDRKAPDFPTSHDIRDWLAGRLGVDQEASVRLLCAVAPFLVAYHAPAGKPELDDLVHRTLLAIFRQREGLDPDCPLTMWLLALTRQGLTEYFDTSRADRFGSGAIDVSYREVEGVNGGSMPRGTPSRASPSATAR